MRQFLTILFSDIANSTALYQTHGDIEAHRQVTRCFYELSSIIENCNGTLLRTVGDSVLASFNNSDNAFNAAVRMQRETHRTPLALRVGFHWGEVIPDNGDVYGNSVNVAARVVAFANASEIYTTKATFDNLNSHNRKRATYLDAVNLKGIENLIPVYRIDWSDDGVSASTRIIPDSNRCFQVHNSLADTREYLELLVDDQAIVIDRNNPAVTIGRALSNDIVIEHESTSRLHARVELLSGKYVVRDTSTNGTYVSKNGQRVIFVRREQTELDLEGIIGAGWDPLREEAHTIKFKLTKTQTPKI